MKPETKPKLTPRQKQIVKKMQDGWRMLTGLSDTTGQPYYHVSKGYDNDYFKSNVFAALINKGVIYQESRYFEYVLTGLGESI